MNSEVAAVYGPHRRDVGKGFNGAPERRGDCTRCKLVVGAFLGRSLRLADCHLAHGAADHGPC